MRALYPDTDAVASSSRFTGVVGALQMIVLVAAVLMVTASAVTWAVRHAVGSWRAAARARTGVRVSLGAAAIAGAGVA